MAECYRGYKYEIENDEYADSPREWGDNLGKLVFSHKRYDFPNEIKVNFDKFESWGEVENHLCRMGYIVFPVYMYDHSGLSFNMGGYSPYWVHSAWDAGQVGFIVTTKEMIRETYGIKQITKKVMKRVEDDLRREVEEYGAYVGGFACGFIIYGEDDERIDSCGGYYDVDDCVTDAQLFIDDLIKQAESESWEKFNVEVAYE